MDLLKGSSCVQPFDLDGEKATLGTRWLEYMEDIDIYLEAANINDEGRKKAIMLHLGGQGLRRVAKTLDCTPRAEVLAVVGPPAVAAVPAVTLRCPQTCSHWLLPAPSKQRPSASLF